MNENVTAIQQAKAHWERRDTATKEQRVNAVIELAEWRLFSNAQIARLVGMDPHDVAEYTGKRDRTGGKLTGESLAPILEIIANDARGEVDDFAFRRALAAGASTRMVAKLTKITQSTVARRGRAA